MLDMVENQKRACFITSDTKIVARFGDNTILKDAKTLKLGDEVLTMAGDFERILILNFH